MWVLDASIAVKWFFKDEIEFEKANLVLNNLIEDPDTFMVPELFYLELSAVLIRKANFDADFVNSSMESIYELGIPTVPAGQELLQKAIALACRFKISLYDSIYAALAESVNGKWLTADKKACHKLEKETSHLLDHF